MVVKARLRGANQLAKILGDLGPAIANKGGDTAARAGGEVLLKQVYANLERSKKSGDLQASLIQLDGTAALKAAGRFGIKINQHTRMSLIAFGPPTSRRAHLLEYGTQFAVAQPFMRPALDSAQGGATKTARAKLEAVTVREVRKARKIHQAAGIK